MVQSPEMDNKGYLSADRVWPFENTLTPAWSLQVAQIGYDTLVFFFYFLFFCAVLKCVYSMECI